MVCLDFEILKIRRFFMGKGQGNGGGWPSTTGNPSGGGRSNGSSGGGKSK
jgi:hypothetical protein